MCDLSTVERLRGQVCLSIWDERFSLEQTNLPTADGYMNYIRYSEAYLKGPLTHTFELCHRLTLAPYHDVLLLITKKPFLAPFFVLSQFGLS